MIRIGLEIAVAGFLVGLGVESGLKSLARVLDRRLFAAARKRAWKTRKASSHNDNISGAR